MLNLSPNNHQPYLSLLSCQIFQSQVEFEEFQDLLRVLEERLNCASDSDNN